MASASELAGSPEPQLHFEDVQILGLCFFALAELVMYSGQGTACRERFGVMLPYSHRAGLDHRLECLAGFDETMLSLQGHAELLSRCDSVRMIVSEQLTLDVDDLDQRRLGSVEVRSRVSEFSQRAPRREGVQGAVRPACQTRPCNAMVSECSLSASRFCANLSSPML